MKSGLDEIYVDRVLTSLYDALNPAGEDTGFYLSLPAPGSAILDIGCGTGLLGVEFARHGHDVTGLDPAAAMLEIAKDRPGGERVNWLQADARDFDLNRMFDLILMTGHVFQVFLEDEDALRALTAARRHLKPGGRLVFESRNPAARGWEAWTPLHSRKVIEHPALGRVETWHSVDDVKAGRVAFFSFCQLPGRPVPIVSRSELAFRSVGELDDLLSASGFRDTRWLGDWHGKPLDADSAEIIVIAR
ncbi:class I SAM-dependent methyltransferase [Pararhizobium arenae]|uniref:class I SAM-dependent methyltransferase n=1 Tax=Pararhizobium arenae TaxID=1856850 RepID=UPI00094B0F59|nr:class I SAM-dependent methyltransferase [Pararhizobium arenae]